MAIILLTGSVYFSSDRYTDVTVIQPLYLGESKQYIEGFRNIGFDQEDLVIKKKDFVSSPVYWEAETNNCPRSGDEANGINLLLALSPAGINLLLALSPAGIVQQRQTCDRKVRLGHTRED